MQAARREDLIANRQQLAGGVPQRRLDQDEHAIGREQRRPGANATGTQRHPFRRLAIDEELVQEVRGDDEIEFVAHSRQLDRQVRPHEARASRPIDRHHLERLTKSRPQHASGGAGPSAQIDGPTRRRGTARAVDLGEDARQGRLGTRRDVAGVLGAQRRVRQIRRPDQLARSDQPRVNGRAALSLSARIARPGRGQRPTPFRRCL